MLVTAETTRAILAEERVGVGAWAIRHKWGLEFDLEALLLHAVTSHPDGQPVFLTAAFDDYRGLPPIWLFTARDGDETAPSAWPKPGQVAGGPSIFHSVGVICAHFSRRAYKEFNGPHATNWGSAATWLDIREGVQARTIGDMLAVIDTHLRVSPGRMG